MEDSNVTLNGQTISTKELQEKKQEVPKNKKIVEVKPNEFKTLTRMRE